MGRLVAVADAAFQEGLFHIHGRAGGQIDGAAQALGLMVGKRGLVDHQAVDRTGGDGVVFHRAPAAAEIGAARIGVEQRHAAEGRPSQVAIDAADVDETALARVGRDRDPGDAAERFGGVEVGVLQDGFRRLDIDEIGRGELPFTGERFLAGCGHHNHAAYRVTRRRRGGRGMAAEGDEQSRGAQ